MRPLQIKCARNNGTTVRFSVEGAHARIEFHMAGESDALAVFIPYPKAARLSGWLGDAVQELCLPPEETSDEVI